jgi:cellulose synthase/poly-beta-1,6-N-acetylglucosamine synthase-like glycosyltransferase
MNLETLALIAVVLAAIPCGMFVLNLFFYRRLPRAAAHASHITHHAPRPSPLASPALSVLIPARNEESNIVATLESVLANREREI